MQAAELSYVAKLSLNGKVLEIGVENEAVKTPSHAITAWRGT